MVSTKVALPATIRIDPEVWLGLQEVAKRKGTNRNRLVTDVLTAIYKVAA
jgi:hypothetical protein